MNYFTGTPDQFTSGLAVGQKVTLEYLLAQLERFGCEITPAAVIEALEMMGYDRDSEVELCKSPD